MNPEDPLRKQFEPALPVVPGSAHARSNAGANWEKLFFTEPSSAPTPKRRALFFVDFAKCRQTSGFEIELKFQERLKSGEWGALRAGQLEAYAIDQFDDEQDRVLLSILLSPLNVAKTTEKGSSGLVVDSLLLPLVLPLLLDSGRLFSCSPSAEPLQLIRGEGQWSFELDVSEEAGGYRVAGLLRQKQVKIALRGERELALFDCGYFFWKGTVERIAWGSHFALARSLCAQSFFVPNSDEGRLLTSLYSRPDFPDFRLPTALQWPLVDGTPRAVMTFQKADESGSIFSRRAKLSYAEIEVEPGSTQKMLVDTIRRLRIRRSMKMEKHYFARSNDSAAVAVADLPGEIESLQSRGWDVALDGRPVLALSRTAGQLRKVGDDFVLDLWFYFGDEAVNLRSFFAACARGERYLPLVLNKYGFLADEWLDRIDLLLRGAQLDKGGSLRFKRACLPLFRPVFASIPGLELDEDAQLVFAGLERLMQPNSTEKPKELRATLRPYQSQGLSWLERVAASGFGGILADDMGLGKTVQVIAYLLRRTEKGKPCLVVVPKSLVFNWLAELAKFAPKLRVLDFAVGTRGLLRAAQYDVVVTTYHILKNELDRFEKLEFDSIILDEAQTIKNPASQVAKAVCALRGVNRFALTGTPIENSLLDLFSLMQFTNPGLIPSGIAVSVGAGRTGALSKATLNRLALAVGPFILRRTKKQVLTELPDKCEQELVCELEGEQKRLYDRLKKQYRESLKQDLHGQQPGAVRMRVLEALLRLRQACCHPALVDPALAGESCAKFEMLLEHLEEIRAAGHKALVFSQFTSFLALLKPRLEQAGYRYEYLDGQTRDRGAVVNKFNTDPATTVFLISLKAGGTGLNLTTASYVFLLDPWWNPAVEAQAIDRAYRMGQTQKVMAYRVLAQGTIEEKIVRLQGQKRVLAETVISDDPSFLRGLSVDDLAALFD